LVGVLGKGYTLFSTIPQGGLQSEMAMSTPTEETQQTSRRRRPKAIQVVAVVGLIVVFGAGGAVYHFRYGDRTTSNYHVISCLPGWARERGNRADRLLQTTLEQYLPQFDTERWTSTEERDVPVRGAQQRVKFATSYRAEDHKEVRIITLDNLSSENGVISLYYQSSIHSSTEDEIARLLKSLQ
jgi:hypothetical protein